MKSDDYAYGMWPKPANQIGEIVSLTKKLRKSLGFSPTPPFDDTVKKAIDRVDAQFAELPFMKADKAIIMANLIREQKLSRLLEFGTYQGKSTAYMAALVDAMGHGHVTTIDRPVIRNHEPNVFAVLKSLELEHHVTVHLEPTCLTWRLMRMLEEKPQPLFDFCYLDAGHVWETTGFAFFLADRLLAPGGWLIFDDLSWTRANSARRSGKLEQIRKRFPQEEMETEQVRKVWDLLVKTHPNYDEHSEVGQWGITRKKPLVA